MPKFLTIGYDREVGDERTPAAIHDAAHLHDAEMLDGGASIGVAGRPVQARNTLNEAV